MARDSARASTKNRVALTAVRTPQAPEPRPRKRQAVTKTCKSSTIALIKQNSANSPLLSLPSEVREYILKFLVGDKLIHVRHLNRDEEKEYNARRGLTKRDPVKAGSFRHAICSNVRPFAQACGGSTDHKDCAIYQSDALHDEKLIRLHASAYCPMYGALFILSVCRQLYEESNFILWTTNTFSFDHSASLTAFVTSLNLAQKRNLKKLHIIVNTQKNIRFGTDLWPSAWNSKYLSMFRGVESLSLCIEHLLWNISPRPVEDLSEKECDILWMNCMDRIGNLVSLRVLPIKHLNLVINDATPIHDLPYSFYYLPEAYRLKYSKGLTEALLDPQGADVQKAADEEASQKNRERVARQRKSFEARQLQIAQDNIEGARERAKLSGVHAVLCESEANRALEKLSVGSHDPQVYERLDARAQKARATADKAAEMLKIWEVRLSQRQKLGDAQAEKEAKAARKASGPDV